MKVFNKGTAEIPVAGFMCCDEVLWHSQTVDKTGKDMTGSFILNCSVCKKHSEKSKRAAIPERLPDQSDEDYNKMCLGLVSFAVTTDLLFEMAELWQEKYQDVAGLYCIDGVYLVKGPSIGSEDG